MLKRKFSVFLIILLSIALILPCFIASVSSSSGAIYINSKTASTPGQQIQAGDSVNLYLGSVTWTGEQTFFMLTTDNSLSETTGYIYTPGMSVYHIADTTQTHTYTSGGSYSWVVGDYWVNGTIPQSIVPGSYYIKAIDDVSSRTAITDTCITVTALNYVASLTISPSAGPGGIPITFTGSGYPAGDKISIQYYDPFFNQWRLMTETTADAKGQISVNSTVPDLKKSVGSYDSDETYTEIQYRTQGVGVPGGVYSSASYAQYARGLKTIGDQTAYGLFGNGTNLQSVKALVGETLVLSGKWFHSNDQIYIRWGSDDIVGTITSDQWANAQIIGSTIASKNGSFSTTLTIPETAYAGEHYIAIEDSEARVAIKIYVSKAHLEITPSSGPGGANVQFTGSLYPPNTNINIYYLDPDLNIWNYWTNTLSDSTGKIAFNTKIPDLNKAGYGGESIGSTPISFRTEINQIPYAYATYTQYWRGLSQIGNAIAYYGVFGDGTNLAQRINVEPGDKLYVSGRWFHSNDAIYVRFDDNQIIGSSYTSTTLTSDDWLKAEIIGTTTANTAGSFETTITIPQTLEGAHYIAFEDSERRVSIIISVTVPNNSTPTPTPPPTSAPTPPPTTNPTKPPTPTLTPTPQPTVAPNIDLSCISTVAGSLFRVDINGSVTLNNKPLSDKAVLISYSVTGGRTWESLTLAQTTTDGIFSVVWTPEVTGNYLIKATVEATQTTALSEKTINLALIPDNPENPNSNMFTINSNSTIREFKFDPDNKRLTFTVEGPTGTTGTVNVYIPKATLSSISTLKAYIDDNNQVDFSSTSKGDSWLISFSYTHSIHQIALDLDATPANTQPANNTANWATYAIIITVVAITVAVVGTIVHKRKIKN